MERVKILEQKNLIIPRPERLKETLAAIQKEGADKFHVLADFDRTLTKAFVNGEKSSSVIAQIRNSNYLGTDYNTKAHALFDKYSPFEHNTSLPFADRSKILREWWNEHHALMIASGLTEKILDEVVAKKTLQFRDGALDFIGALAGKNIPLIIMSAGSGDIIAKYLAQENRLTPNVHVVANKYKFDGQGRMIGVEEPVIHSLNKHEITLDGLPLFDQIKNRRNVMLLGDSVDDLGMIEGFDYDHLLKIGFLNEPNEAREKEFRERFDMIVSHDDNMNEVNNIIRTIN